MLLPRIKRKSGNKYQKILSDSPGEPGAIRTAGTRSRGAGTPGGAPTICGLSVRARAGLGTEQGQGPKQRAGPQAAASRQRNPPGTGRPPRMEGLETRGPWIPGRRAGRDTGREGCQFFPPDVCWVVKLHQTKTTVPGHNSTSSASCSESGIRGDNGSRELITMNFQPKHLGEGTDGTHSPALSQLSP